MAKLANQRVKPNMKMMSSGAATIYRALFDDLKAAKQLEQTITKTVLTIFGFIAGLQRAFGLELEKVCPLLAIVLLAGLFLFYSIQRQKNATRKRMKRIEEKRSNFFSSEERTIFELDGDESGVCRDALSTLTHVTLMVGGAVLTYYSLLLPSACLAIPNL